MLESVKTEVLGMTFTLEIGDEIRASAGSGLFIRGQVQDIQDDKVLVRGRWVSLADVKTDSWIEETRQKNQATARAATAAQLALLRVQNNRSLEEREARRASREALREAKRIERERARAAKLEAEAVYAGTMDELFYWLDGKVAGLEASVKKPAVFAAWVHSVNGQTLTLGEDGFTEAHPRRMFDGYTIKLTEPWPESFKDFIEAKQQRHGVRITEPMTSNRMAIFNNAIVREALRRGYKIGTCK